MDSKGVEPSTFRMRTERSSQLSYEPSTVLWPLEPEDIVHFDFIILLLLESFVKSFYLPAKQTINQSLSSTNFRLIFCAF